MNQPVSIQTSVRISAFVECVLHQWLIHSAVLQSRPSPWIPPCTARSCRTPAAWSASWSRWWTCRPARWRRCPGSPGWCSPGAESSVKLCSVWSNHIWLFWPPSPLSRTCPWLMVASSEVLGELHHTVLSKLLRQYLNSNRVCLWENTTNTIYGLKLGFYVQRIWIVILTLVWV